MHRPLAAAALRFGGTGDVRTRVRPPPRPRQSLFLQKTPARRCVLASAMPPRTLTARLALFYAVRRRAEMANLAEGFAACRRWCRVCSAAAAAEPAILFFSLTRISTQSDNDVACFPLQWAMIQAAYTRPRRPRKIREASPSVVVDAVVAPEDGSGPGRSVRHQNGHLAPTSQKGRDLAMKRVGHPLSSTRDGRATAEAGSAG